MILSFTTNSVRCFLACFVFTNCLLEQNSEPGKVNVSSSTYNMVKDDYHFTHRGKIEAKNKGQIDMFFVEMKEMVGKPATS